MLYALFTGERGLFIRDRYGNAISQLAFEAPVELGESTETVRAIHFYLFFLLSLEFSSDSLSSLNSPPILMSPSSLSN
jgi:hypothetical protein